MALDVRARAAIESSAQAEKSFWHILADLASFGICRLHRLAG
jgi:hypothetical protein